MKKATVQISTSPGLNLSPKCRPSGKAKPKPEITRPLPYTMDPELRAKIEAARNGEPQRYVVQNGMVIRKVS